MGKNVGLKMKKKNLSSSEENFIHLLSMAMTRLQFGHKKELISFSSRHETKLKNHRH